MKNFTLHKNTFRVLLAMPVSEYSQQISSQLEALQVYPENASSLLEIIQKIHKSEKFDLIVVATDSHRINYMDVASFIQNSLQHKPALVAVSKEFCISEKRRCLAANMQDYTANPSTEFWFEILDKISLNKSAQQQTHELVPLFSKEKTERMCQLHSQEYLDKVSQSFVNHAKDSFEKISESMKFFDIRVVAEQIEILKNQSHHVGALAMLNAIQKTEENMRFKPDLEKELENLQKIADLTVKKIRKMFVSKHRVEAMAR